MKISFSKMCCLGVSLFFLLACSVQPEMKQFSPGVSGPQLLVEPDTVSLGVAELLATKIVFRGKGFMPGDSVCIKILGTDQDGRPLELPIASAIVDKQGYFVARVQKLAKITEIIRADISLNSEMQPKVVLTKPPVPAKTYNVLAESLEAGLTAKGKITFKDPSFGERLVDKIGEAQGKIVNRLK